MNGSISRRWRGVTQFVSLSWLVAWLLPAAVVANGAFISGGFIKGADLPWIDGDFYNDLAVNPHYPDWGCGYSSADMNRYLADLHSMGITVVRFWINTDDQGCTLDANGYVTGVTSLFWTNLDNVVSLASHNAISLYLTLNEGRADWLYTNAMANAYKTNCLIPMIQRYKGNQGVFAIDLMNEIDGVVGGSDGNYGTGPTWAQAQAYITDFASAVHGADSNRLVSCSTGWHQWHNLGYFTGLGLDFYDFHEYEDTISLPLASTLGMDKPIYIGECGQALSDTNWNDSLQNACEIEALNGGLSGGYAGASIWSYSLPDWQTSGYTQYAMLNADGSWRQVCYTIQSWNPLWENAADLGSGWRWLDWFGFFAEAGNKWIFHLQHGWMYPVGTDSASVWFWTSDMGWLWTGSTTYPYLYRSSDGAWLWYLKDSSLPRWFYNYKVGSWEQH